MHVSSRLRGGALAGALVLVSGLALPTAALAADDPVVKDDPIRFESGHIDAFNLVLNADDSVRLLLKEDVTGSHVLRTPESVELFVASDAVTTGIPTAALPDGAPESFSYLPLTQDHKLIWPGWDTQSVQSAYPGAKTTFDVDVDGPGEIFLWSNGTFGDVKSLLVGGGYTLPGSIDQPFPAHAHANWAFTEPGEYTLTATAQVQSADGTKTSTSNEATYTFIVAPAPNAVSVTGAEDAVSPGSDVTLAAAQAPAGASFSAYSWQTRATAGDEWSPVADATTAEITVSAVDGAQYRATVSGGKDYTSGTATPMSVSSDPVTISTTDEQEPSPQTIAIAALADHYHSGSPIDLAITADPAVENGQYRWYVQRVDQDEPVAIDGATGATHRLVAEQALNDAIVTAELVDAEGDVLATAEPATIEVDDHGAAPLQKVTIGGLADHYHSGDDATLSATVEPQSVLTAFQWFVQKHGETQPQPIDGATSADHTFTVTEELDGAAVIAALTYDDGRTYAQSAPAIVNLDDHGAVPDTQLTIATSRDADDYWVGQTATLTAEQSVPTGLTEYEWLTKLPGADDFTVVEDETAVEYSFKPTLANSGVQVKVRLVRDGETHAESDAVTITAQQRPVATTLTVTADKDEYAPGDTAQLTSAQNPQTGVEHYHWYIKRAGASDYVWVDQSRDKDLAYPVTAEDDGAQLVIRLFDETHATIAESAPVTLNVSGGSTDPEPVTELRIDGLADGYHVGETATLTAIQTPETGEDHWHWFIKRAGDADYSVISGALTATLTHEVTAADADATVVAKLYDHDHAVIAESSPVSITVLSGSAKPGDAPAAQTAGALEGIAAGGISVSTDAPQAGQVVTVEVGAERAGEWVAAWLFSEPVLLNGDWTQVAADGTIAVTIPADTEPGAHRLAVFDAEGAVIGWQQLQISAADAAGGGASGALATTGGSIDGGWLGAAILLLLAGSSVFVVSRRMMRRGQSAAE